MKEIFLLFVLALLLFKGNSQEANLVLPIGHTKDVIGYKITPDEKYLITASEDGTGKIWNYRTGKFMYDLKLHGNRLTGIDMSKDGSFVVLSSADGTYSKWETSTGKMLFHSTARSAIRQINLLSGDSALLLVTDYGIIIDAFNNDYTALDNYLESNTRTVAISPDNKSIAVFKKGDGIIVYSLPEGTEKSYMREVTVDSINYYDLSLFSTLDFLSFTSNNELIIALNSKIMAGFNIQTKKQSFYYNSRDDRISQFTFNADRTLMAFIDNIYDEIKIWDTRLKKVVGKIPNSNKLRIIKFSELSSNLILNRFNKIEEWSVKGELLKQRSTKDEMPYEKPVLNRTETIAIVIVKNGLQTFNWKNGELKNEFTGKIEQVKKVLVSKSRKWLFEIKDNYSNFWNLNTMSAFRFPENNEEKVKDIFLTNKEDRVLLQYENAFSVFDCISNSVVYTKKTGWNSKIYMIKGDSSFISIRTWGHLYDFKDTTLINKWSLSDGESLKEWYSNRSIANATISDNGELMAYNISNINDDSVFVWDLVNNKKIISFYRPAQYVQNAIAGYFLKYNPNFYFTNDCKFLFFSVGGGGRLRYIELPNKKSNGNIKEPLDTVEQEIEFLDNEGLGLFDLFSTYYPINIISKNKTVIVSTTSESDDPVVRGFNYESNEEVFRLPYEEHQRIMFYDNTNNQLYTATKTEWLLWDIKKQRIINSWGIPEGMEALEFLPDEKQFLIASNDRIGIQFMSTEKPIYFFSTLDNNQSISYRDDRYYKVTPNAAASLSWNINNKFYDFDQWDVQFNRPDKMLELTGNKELNIAYYKAYQKRLKKNGLTENNFDTTTTLPQILILNKITDGELLRDSKFFLKIKILPNNSNLIKKIFILINGNPIFSKQGMQTLISSDTVLQFPIQLANNLNNIKVSCMDEFGNESIREQLQVLYQSNLPAKSKLHFIGIGIDKFADNKFNLQYSSKDIRDLAIKLKEKYKDNIIIDTLFNENVTTANVKKLKAELLRTSVNDKVIVSYSGHGLLSKDYDYYLSTYSVNFNKPEENGLPYDELENLLDSIPARKKLMLIDACHSGEVDKEEMQRYAQSENKLDTGVKGARKLELNNNAKLGMKNSFELMQNLFVNVGKSTGATIISAAAGTQFALERSDLKNGVFTYCILEEMKKNIPTTISQLKKIVGEQVEKMTNGLQKPTSRNENVAVDWHVW